MDHVGVNNAVDDELAHILPLLVFQVCEDVCMGLIRQQHVEQRHMAVLQHAVVIVHARKLVPRVDQECIVQTCMAANG